MKKSVRLGFFLLGILIIGILSITSFVSANFELGTLGNSSSVNGYILESEQPGNANLRGLVNLSVSDEAFNSVFNLVLDGVNHKVSLLEVLQDNLLDKDDGDFSCTTSECNRTYSIVGEGFASKKINLGSNEKKTLGLNVQADTVSGIPEDGFSFKVSSNYPGSCKSPLQIDVLNDGIIEWQAHNVQDNYCSANNGYFESNVNIEYLEIPQQDFDEYCSRFSVDAVPKLKVGGNIKVEDPANVNLIFYIKDENGFPFEDCADLCSCEVSAPTGSNSNGGLESVSCEIEFTSMQEREAYICVAKDSSEGRYLIKAEDNSPQGFTNSGGYYDFDLFVQNPVFSSIGEVDFSTDGLSGLDLDFLYENSLEDYIYSDYIYDVYSGNCKDGCVIPISFISSYNQEINLSDIALSYLSAGIRTSENFYETQEKPSLIDMNFTILDLSKLNIKTPGETGTYDVSLYLGDKAIFEDEEIRVEDVPLIDFVYPQKVPALIEVLFRAYYTGSNATKFIWDFGENLTVLETTEPTVVYKYLDLGAYILNLTIENNRGESTSKTTLIKVLSPEEFMEQIFNESQQNLDHISSELNKLDSWTKDYLYGLLQLEEKQIQLTKLIKDYEGSGSSSEYVTILKNLEDLNIPSEFYIQKTGNVNLFLDRSDVDLDVLSLLGAGESKKEEYKDAIVEWFTRSLKVEMQGESYWVVVDGLENNIASQIKLDVKPKNSLDDVYFVLNNPRLDTTFKQSFDVKDVSDSLGIHFSNLGEQEIDFIVKGKRDILDGGIYFSPLFSKLSGVVSENDFGICNNNGFCEGEETWKNCRRDCKPWPWILFWLIIILFILFVVYVFLQEMYKRKYEGYLFVSKDELYNLINFMDNGEKQGFNKKQIYEKLKVKGWTQEQLDYAWKKYKGLRTGMWEIPVFKVLEKIKVKKEILKRTNKLEINSPRTIPIGSKPGLFFKSRINSSPNRPQARFPMNVNLKKPMIKPPLEKQNINKSINSSKNIKK